VGAEGDEGGRAVALREGERKRRISQDCASGEGELHFAVVFAETTRAATGAPASTNRGCSTGCRDRWRQSKCLPDSHLTFDH
jgi:hypothetical protein